MLMRVPSRGRSAEFRPGRLQLPGRRGRGRDGDRGVRHQCRRQTPLSVCQTSRGVFELGRAVFSAAQSAAGPTVLKQTAFYPYYNKNNIHYDQFDWHIYTTDHFEIYYYPELEHHLERVAGYAESAYQKVSSDLRHDLSIKVPLILFKTHSEFEQQNVAPGAATGRRRRVRRAVPRSHAAADRRSPRSALRPHRPRAHAHLRVRHHPAVADSPQRAAVGERGSVGVRARRLDAVRLDAGARRGGGRHRAEDDARKRATARRAAAASWPTTSDTRCSSSSKRGSGRKGSAASCSR